MIIQINPHLQVIVHLYHYIFFITIYFNIYKIIYIPNMIIYRNIIPKNLRRKIKNIKYPTQKDEEIIIICKEKRNKKFDKEDA